MDDDLAEFLSPMTAFAEETRIWAPLGTMRIVCYLTDKTPPIRYVSSARAVVIDDDRVLLVQDPHEIHIIPGGRLESGETPEEAMRREVIEETGWSLAFWKPIGVLHFTLVCPMSQGQKVQPDFLQVVYAGVPGKYHPELREADGYEIGSEFVSIDRVRRMPLGSGQLKFLEAALTATSRSP
ncbi:MAG: NUDIX hydrolase [Chloroflexi bacterium]|nr:NUDIX hydrolase [Chloroflexota bacterium]